MSSLSDTLVMQDRDLWIHKAGFFKGILLLFVRTQVMYQIISSIRVAWHYKRLFGINYFNGVEFSIDSQLGFTGDECPIPVMVDSGSETIN